MNKILVAAAISAGLIPAFFAQVQMPGDTAPGQTKTLPVKPKTPPATKSVPGAKAVPPASQGTTAAEDKQIEATIRAKLAKSKIGRDGFMVRVQGGVAFWEGNTSVVQHKGSATRMAKTAGARSVVNNIKVTDAAKQKAAENLDQGRRRAQVKRSDPRTQQ